MKFLCAFAILLATTVAVSQTPTDNDSAELTRLETVWNNAHLAGDADALNQLWADDLEVAVPHMSVIHKNEALRILRSGRIKFQKYETSDLHIRIYGNSAVVTGLVLRVRTYNGNTITDNWRFTKIYEKEGGDWKVVSVHASEAAQP